MGPSGLKKFKKFIRRGVIESWVRMGLLTIEMSVSKGFINIHK